MAGGGWATEQRLGDDISETGLLLRWESLKCHDSVPGVLRRTQPFFGELIRGMALPREPSQTPGSLILKVRTPG